MGKMHAVVFDPKHEYWPGALVEDGVALELGRRGCLTIPVLRELMKRNAVSGLFMRSWGSGWRLGSPAPQRACPLILNIAPGHDYVNWRARIMLDEGGEFGDGQLRIVADSAQVGAHASGFTALDHASIKFAQLGPMDDGGGWNVGGQAKVASAIEGFLGLTLWGSGASTRVIAAAVSQTSQ